ncbi:MAG: hypothetical protein WCV80_02895 [Candidatus Paceibacterota bacterium]|jgi:hypothetical protein
MKERKIKLSIIFGALLFFFIGCASPTISEAVGFRMWEQLKQFPWASYYKSESLTTALELGKDGKYIYVATGYDGLTPGLEKRNTANGLLCANNIVCESEFGTKGVVTGKNDKGVIVVPQTFDTNHYTDLKYDAITNVIYTFGTSNGAELRWVIDRYNGTTGVFLGRNIVKNTSGHAARAVKIVKTPGSIIVGGWINTNNTNWSFKQFLIEANGTLTYDTTYGGVIINENGVISANIPSPDGTAIISGPGGMEMTDMVWVNERSWTHGRVVVSGIINKVGKIIALQSGYPYYPSGAISFTGSYANNAIRDLELLSPTDVNGDLFVVARSTNDASTTSTSHIYQIPIGDGTDSYWSPYVVLQNKTSLVAFTDWSTKGLPFFVGKITHDSSGIYLFGTNQNKLVLEKRLYDGSFVSRTRFAFPNIYAPVGMVVGGTGLATDPVYLSGNADYHSIGFKESFIRVEPQVKDNMPIRIAHMEDFRESVNGVRNILGLSDASWDLMTPAGSDNSEIVGKPIRAANLLGIRLRSYLLRGCITVSDEEVTGGIGVQGVIRKGDFNNVASLIDGTFADIVTGFDLNTFLNTTCVRGSTTYNTPTSTVFTVPAGVYVVKVDISGGGGGGGGCARDCQYGGGSGGDGGSTTMMVSVTPGTDIPIVVGGAGKRGIGKVGGIGPGGGGGGGGGGSAFGTYKVGGGGGAGGAKVYETGYNYGDGGQGDSDGGGGGGGGGQGDDGRGGPGGAGGFAGGGGGGAGLGGRGGGVRVSGGAGGDAASPFNAGGAGTCSQRGNPVGCNDSGGGGGAGGNGATGGGASSYKADFRDGKNGSSAISQNPSILILNAITPAQGGDYQGYVSGGYKSGADGSDGFVRIYW